MRRMGLVVFVLAVAGCSVLKDAFSAHPTVAAQAAGQVLTVERLAEISSRIKGMPLQQQNLLRVAGSWVDYTLFVMALAHGDSLRDSALVAQTLWPRVAQDKFEHFIGLQASGRSKLSAAQVDSAYQAGDQRLFQHILIQVPPNAAPPVVQQKETAAKGILRQVNAGGGRDFAALAKRYSEDPGSKANGGSLGVGGRGRFVAQFEDAAWQLAPGGITAVVRSPFGFHIVRRPPLAEVRDSFADGISQVLRDRYDSTFFARLQQERKIQLASRAAATARAAVQDMDRARESDAAITTFKGGTFRERDFARWMLAVDSRIPQTLPSATDNQIDELLLQLTQRHIAVMQAESAKVQLDADEWAGLRADYDSALGMLEGFLKVSPQLLRDSATTLEGRERMAMTRVNEFFDRAVSGQAPFVPVPPFLAQALKQRATYSFDQPGVRRAVERAGELRSSADSLQAPTARPGLRPSPAPPLPPGAKQVGPTRRTLQ